MPWWKLFTRRHTPSALITAQIFIAPTDPSTYAAIKQDLFAWRAAWNSQIGSTFITSSPSPYPSLASNNTRHRRRVLVVTASHAACEHLPSGTTYVIIPPLQPIRAVAARVKHRSYDLHGARVDGTKHFAPGSLVYPHPARWGDGYERAYVTGRHRDTQKYVTLICATNRFEHWHHLEVLDPIIIYELHYNGIPWTKESEQDLDAFVAVMNERMDLRLME